MKTITPEQEKQIAAKVASIPNIPTGIGNKEACCSIAAINMALSGRLTDSIPECMSEVIGQWIIVIQDSIPSEMRNSVEWRNLLPLAAGTGRQREQKLKNMILEWMWKCLEEIQPIADKLGFGKEWKNMTTNKSAHTADAAAHAARDAAAAAHAAHAAADAVRAARAADVAGAAARAVDVAGAADAADAAAHAAAHAAHAADAAAAAYWKATNPIGLLEKLINTAIQD